MVLLPALKLVAVVSPVTIMLIAIRQRRAKVLTATMVMATAITTTKTIIIIKAIPITLTTAHPSHNVNNVVGVRQAFVVQTVVCNHKMCGCAAAIMANGIQLTAKSTRFI